MRTSPHGNENEPPGEVSLNGAFGEIAAAEERSILQHLERLASTPGPRHSFVAQLRGELMDTALQPLMNGITHRPKSIAIRHRPAAGGARRSSSWAQPFGLAAALLLIGLMLAGIAAYYSSPGDNEPTVPAMAATGDPATPQADVIPLADASDVASWVLLPQEFFPSAVESGTAARLEGWVVAPGASVQISDEQAAASPGVAVDFVMNGAYAATFNGPISITRAAPNTTSRIERIAAGTRVELTTGDAVVYQLDRGREITNPLAGTDLQIQRVVLAVNSSGADAAPSYPGATITLEATDEIPDVFKDRGETFIMKLIYYRLDANMTLDPGQYKVLFNAEAQASSAESIEGYLVTIEEPRG